MTENNKKQKSNNDSEKQIEWGGFLNEFLWICAGVNRKVLRQCPTEYAKYAGIGGIILFTALMAMLSGGYAMYFVFDSQLMAIAFGVFWGFLIFNLVRYIITTISRKKLLYGLPLIILAVFLSIAISVPFELKIFEDEIGYMCAETNVGILKAREQKEFTYKEYEDERLNYHTRNNRLINQMSAFSKLINENYNVMILSIFVTLLFIIIVTIPIFVKMSSLDLYELKLQAEKDSLINNSIEK